MRTFSTRTDDLLALSDWLTAEGYTHGAIESTGGYWKPVFNILEGDMAGSLGNARHGNARHVKAVPSRKTDVKDCAWRADLLRHGLLQTSFLPPWEIRELRGLTRYRQTLVRAQAAVANRVPRSIESGNIKLAQVATATLGTSGRRMLRALAAGEAEVAKLAEMARGRLRAKQVELQRALRGRLTAAQRFVLGELLDRYDELAAAIFRGPEQSRPAVADGPDPFVREALQLLQTMPGVGERVAETLVSELGVDMRRFPRDAHLARWAGRCPSNHESAGKRKRGKTTKGNIPLRTALTQAAWTATHTKQTSLAAQYRRLVKPKGKKRALVAVGHSRLVIAYPLLARQASYQALGGDSFDRRNVDVQRTRLIRKLEALGVQVTIAALPVAA